jgi:hypothetical protein
VVAGPLKTRPLVSNWEPWHGQTKALSLPYCVMAQDWCVQMALNAVNEHQLRLVL